MATVGAVGPADTHGQADWLEPEPGPELESDPEPEQQREPDPEPEPEREQRVTNIELGQQQPLTGQYHLSVAAGDSSSGKSQPQHRTIDYAWADA